MVPRDDTSQTKTTTTYPPPTPTTQKTTPPSVPTQEQVIIYDVETDSNQNDEPITPVVKKRKVENKQKEPITIQHEKQP